MKIAIYCVNYHSQDRLVHYLESIDEAIQQTQGDLTLNSALLWPIKAVGFSQTISFCAIAVIATTASNIVDKSFFIILIVMRFIRCKGNVFISKYLKNCLTFI